MSSYTSISADKLSRLIGTAHAPTLIDVRIDQDFGACPRVIPGAVRRPHLNTSEWASEFTGRPVIVICQKGKSSVKASRRGYVTAALPRKFWRGALWAGSKRTSRLCLTRSYPPATGVGERSG
jgi:hypothetical protein